jgi:plastocyanin
MHLSLAHCANRQHGRWWLVGLSLTAILALPVLPVTAQPEIQSGPIASTPADCTIHLSVSNPTPGDQEVPRSLVLSGNAIDATASSGTGISQIQAFLGSRDQGGTLIGTGSFASTPGWSLTTVMPPNISGGQQLFVYGTSSVSGQEAFVSIPVVVGESLSPSLVSDSATAFCPSVIPAVAPTSPPLIATVEPTPTAIPTTAPPPAPAPTATPAPVEPITPPLPVVPPAPAPFALSISVPPAPPLTFSTDTLSAPAGSEVAVTFTNDSSLLHSWHAFAGEDSSAPTLAMSNIIGPGQSEIVSFTAPSQPGTYLFLCDVHPNIMMGSLVVEGTN